MVDGACDEEEERIAEAHNGLIMLTRYKLVLQTLHKLYSTAQEKETFIVTSCILTHYKYCRHYIISRALKNGQLEQECVTQSKSV